MGMPEIGLTIFFVAIFYGAAEFEAKSTGAQSHGWLWGASSALVSVLVFMKLGGGVLTLIALQVLLFIGIGAVRAALEMRGK